MVLTEFEVVINGGLGTIRGAKATVSLKPEATPKFCAPRQIPFALKPLVEQKIKRLIDNNTWKEVTYSDWGTPLVPVVKEDGGIRLCGDYKVTLNPHLQVAQHPLPRPDELLAVIGNCKIFSKI